MSATAEGAAGLPKYPRTSRKDIWILISGILLFFAIAEAVVVYPLTKRKAPVEPDDAYAYILRSAMLENCPLRQDCAAIESLRPDMLARTEDPDLAWRRYLELNRTLMVYHPLESFLLLALKKSGMPWERAYAATTIMGPVIIGAGLVCFMTALYAPAVAGIAILLVGLIIWPGQGLHYIVPSNMALGIALLLWGIVLRRSRHSLSALAIGTPLLLAMHPIGRLYTVSAGAMYLALNKQAWRQAKTKIVLGWCLALVAACFVAPIFISRPMLSIPAGPAMPAAARFIGFLDNLVQSTKILRSWTLNFGGFFATVLLLWIGYVALSGDRLTRVRVAAAALAPLPLTGLLFIMPGHAGDLVGRAWIAPACVLTGIIAGAVWLAICALGSRVPRTSWPWQVPVRLLALALCFDVANLALKNTFLKNTHPWESLRAMAQMIAERNDTPFDQAQVDMARSRTRAGSSILYLEEESMHFYLVHGLLDRKAVFVPIAGEKPPTTGIELAVGFNPAGDIRINPDEQLKVASSTEAGLSQAKLTFENRDDTRSEITVRSGDHSVLVELPPHSTVVQAMPDARDRITITRTGAASRVYLTALKISDTRLHWPWGRNIRIVAGSRLIEFDDKALFAPFRIADIVDDGGYSVLARLSRP